MCTYAQTTFPGPVFSSPRRSRTLARAVFEYFDGRQTFLFGRVFRRRLNYRSARGVDELRTRARFTYYTRGYTLRG